jgi:hypothetical protein
MWGWAGPRGERLGESWNYRAVGTTTAPKQTGPLVYRPVPSNTILTRVLATKICWRRTGSFYYLTHKAAASLVGRDLASSRDGLWRQCSNLVGQCLVRAQPWDGILSSCQTHHLRAFSTISMRVVWLLLIWQPQPPSHTSGIYQGAQFKALSAVVPFFFIPNELNRILQ